MQCFEDARKILLDLVGGGGAKRPKRLEGFDYCLGLMEMNSDQRVGKKMAEKGDVLIPQTERSRLVQRATAGHGWLGLGWPLAIDELRKMFPKLKLTQFELNGADDVVKYDKFWSQESSRMVVMGRPGSTEAVREGMAAARPKPIDTDDANFVLGPELPDISSSAARAATVAGDREALKGLAHPAVAEWLISQPWAGAAAAGDGGTAPEPEPEPAAEEGVPPSCSLTEKLIASASVTDDDIKACTAEVESLKQQLLITQPIAKNKTIGKGPPPPPGGGRGGPPPPPPLTAPAPPCTPVKNTTDCPPAWHCATCDLKRGTATDCMSCMAGYTFERQSTDCSGPCVRRPGQGGSRPCCCRRLPPAMTRTIPGPSLHSLSHRQQLCYARPL